MATLLQDTFTDVDGTLLTAHTMNVGGGWTAVNGTWTIQSNTALVLIPTANSIATADAGQADITLTLSLIVPNTADYAVGAVVRTSDANTGWIAVIERDGGTPYLAIFERTAGTNTLRASVNAPSATNSTVTITVVTSGSTITASLSTGETCNYASATSNQTVTKHGLFGYSSLGDYSSGAVDDFLVTGTGGGSSVGANAQTYANLLLAQGRHLVPC